MTDQILLLDFETYYDADYSLRKMPTPSYIMDPRFECQMCAVKEIGKPGFIVDGPDFPKFIGQYDPNKTTTITFNSLFDNSILAWRYGFVPNTMIDAMGMARALLGHKLTSFSLNSIAAYLGLGQKTGALVKVQGMYRSTIIANGLWNEFKNYALQDNDLCEGIFLKLYPQFPWGERRLMDMVLRCAIEPRFQCDFNMLQQHLADVRAAKAALLAASGSDVTALMSTAKFKDKLEALGVTIQYKTTPSGRQSPAFARTDKFMEELGEHPDPAVQALVAARLGHKSTIEETRTEKLMSIAKLPWAQYANGAPRLYSGGNLPVPLRYGGAHTHRLSGDWGMNMQNLPTARGSKGKSKLRASLKAGPGETIIVADLGQIEARLAAWICGCVNLVQQFRDKLDPYSILATEIFGRPINRKLVGTPDEIMGFIGKTGILGLGYGCGKDNFDTMVTRSARMMGMDISAVYNRSVGDKAVDSYRKIYAAIPNGWRRLDNLLNTVWLHGGSAPFGPCTIQHGQILLPNGLSLDYDNPHKRKIMAPARGNPSVMEEREELFYRYGKIEHKIYGAKALENIVQALARIVVMNAALRIRDRGRTRPCPYAYRFVLQAHDELVFIVPDAEVSVAKQIIHEEMTRPPSWGKDIPLTADVGTGSDYAAAK